MYIKTSKKLFLSIYLYLIVLILYFEIEIVLCFLFFFLKLIHRIPLVEQKVWWWQWCKFVFRNIGSNGLHNCINGWPNHFKTSSIGALESTILMFKYVLSFLHFVSLIFKNSERYLCFWSNCNVILYYSINIVSISINVDNKLKEHMLLVKL